MPEPEFQVKPGQSLRAAAHSHRRKVRRVKHLGYEKRIRACSVCGHVICRCSDNKRREEIRREF